MGFGGKCDVGGVSEDADSVVDLGGNLGKEKRELRDDVKSVDEMRSVRDEVSLARESAVVNKPVYLLPVNARPVVISEPVDDEVAMDKKLVNAKPVRINKPVNDNDSVDDTNLVNTNDNNSVDDKTPVDTKSVDTKPVTTKPMNTKPTNTKPATTKPITTKPTNITNPLNTTPLDSYTTALQAFALHNIRHHKQFLLLATLLSHMQLPDGSFPAGNRTIMCRHLFLLVTRRFLRKRPGR